MKQFYEFKVRDINGNFKQMLDYQNQVVLIVNVASKCGFTKQYENLQKIYEKYQNQNFTILGFPCNQFFFQEPKSSNEILTFCQSKYKVTFDIFSKIKVNGKQADPLYVWLKNQKPWSTRAKNVKWNFEKFLIDKYGNVRYRFVSSILPEQFESQIVELINE